MGVGQGRQLGQFESLTRVHDADSPAAVDAINADFDYKMGSLALHE
jgi:hypothetical protein